MSKDDFRDRLKSYSSEAEHANWVKMQQLLDTDNDDRKAIAWWKFGGLFALLLIPIALLIANGTFTKEGMNTQTDITDNTTTQSFNAQEIREEATPLAIVNAQEAKESNTSIVEKSITNEEQLKSKPVKANKSSTQKRIDQKNINSNNKKASQTESIFSRPQANAPSQLKTSQLSKTSQKPTLIKAPLIADKAENLVVSLDQLDQLKPFYFDLDQRVLPGLTYAPYTKVYDEEKHNPWYLVSGVGVKYPIVDISNADVGSLVPSQKFFPSYMAELGIGKHIGKMSVEGGVAGSIYQYKLGRSFTEEEAVADVNTASGGGNQASNNVVEESTFIVNKFAVLSPYVRIQYSFDLKKDYILGLHGMFNLNKKLDLGKQAFSNQFADNSNAAVEFDSFNNVQSLLESKTTNINYDLGFSIEKNLAKRGRIAMDFSYSFATGILEEGSYSVLRQTPRETKGVYNITGMGPKVKFRYYLKTRG